DNAAHVGGLIFGFVFTLVCYSSYKNPFKNLTFGIATVISFCIIIVVAIYIPDYSYRYYKAFNLFRNYEKMANDNFSGTGYVETNTFSNNIRKAETNWQLCNIMLSETKNLPPALTADINSLKKYSRYKSRYYHIYYKAINEEEYQLYDTLEIIGAQISMLPVPENGITPKNNKKENIDKEESLKPVKLYYDSSWQPTTARNAFYFREATVDSLGRINGRVTDYFKSGIIQMKGIYFNDLQDDVCRYYFENGNYDAIGKFRMEDRIGKWKTFYRSGQIKEEMIYGDSNIFFKNFWMEYGIQTVKNGNGIFLNYYSSSEFLRDSGNYHNGFKDGIWKGYYPDGKPYYKELYRDGLLIKGVSISNSGSRYNYTVDYVPPQPIGIAESYEEYLQSNLIYPPAALKNKIEGVLIIDLNVDSNGTKTKIKPVNKLPFGCTDEVLRLVNHGPAFTPAFLKGQPVASVKRVYVKFRINQ
ncbi:MAG: energy transducer TonB, partial [Bacteroidia bacterium]